MLFNSFEYLCFFITVLALCWLLVGMPKLRLWVLLLASYYFYTANNHWLIVLIIISTQVDYIAGIMIADSPSPAARKLFLTVSVLTNLGILAFFKYFNFFAASAVEIANTFHWPLTWTDLNIVLPVGISFYTFQSMSYTIDVYRGDLPVERSWLRFAFYVTYFPQLIAGPIMRASQFMPQITQRPTLTAADWEKSLVLITTGLIKKIVFGDFLARYSDFAFNHPDETTAFTAWLGLYAFTFQIYFDFSGYSDIAIGCSRLMGYHLPDNFRRPYMAHSFSDFWKRWHISLSSWLRDYLYIPLGGNRMKTKWGVHRNLMLTMLLGGLWHGAAWHFILWGVLHGSYLSIERIFTGERSQPASALGLMIKRLLIFHAVVLTWLVFRCENMHILGEYLAALMRTEMPGEITIGMLAAVCVIGFGLLIQWLGECYDLTTQFLRTPILFKSGCYTATSIAVMAFNFSGPMPFIYFQF